MSEVRTEGGDELVEAISQMGKGFRVPVKDANAETTDAYGSLVSVVEKAISHIKIVDMRLVSHVTVQANVDLDGNICKEETGITITISAR